MAALGACGRLALHQSDLTECDNMRKVMEKAMKTYISVAEDLQDGGGKYDSDVDGIEARLLGLAKMDRDLQLVGQAVERAGEEERQYNSGREGEDGGQLRPPELVEALDSALTLLREEDEYNPKTHPQWREFLERVREGGEEEEGEEGEGDADIVMAQVQRSLKCPLTKQYLEDPVTSSQCGHSYSRAAIVQHIRNRRGRQAKCPVCNGPIDMADLETDDGLKRLVQRAKRRSGRGQEQEGVVSL